MLEKLEFFLNLLKFLIVLGIGICKSYKNGNENVSRRVNKLSL